MGKHCISIISIFALMLCIAVWVMAAEDDPENILQNGDFELQFQSWLFWTEGGAIAERHIDEKEMEPVDGKSVAYVKIDNAGTGGNHIQFYQGPFLLKEGNEYTFSVWGKTDGDPQPVELRVLKHENPWTNYALAAVNFTDIWNEYSVTFTQPADDNVSRVDLFLGKADDDVWIDHARLYEGPYFNDGVKELPGQPVEADGKLIGMWGQIKNQ